MEVLVLESRKVNSMRPLAHHTNFKIANSPLLFLMFLVLGKYSDKTAFQEPCVLQTKFGIFLVDVARNRSNSTDQKTEPCISIAMGAMSKEEPPKKRCSELCGRCCFVFLFCFRFSCLWFSVAGAAKIYELCDSVCRRCGKNICEVLRACGRGRCGQNIC